jgi:hypothetical protein
MDRSKYPKAVDCRGVRIRIGQTIVYPVRRGSSMVLREATVCDVPGRGCTVKKGIVALRPTGRRVIIQVPSRCAVISNFNEEE